MKMFIRIISWSLSGVFIAAAAAFLLMRMFGYVPYTVVSGSMEPVYPVGSLVFVKNIPHESVKVGDSISFVLDKNLNVATHRVVKISDNKQYFYTKGDANDTVDAAPVYYKNILGRTEFSIPYLGYASIWLSSSVGKACAIILLVVLLALSVAERVFFGKEKFFLENEAVQGT